MLTVFFLDVMDDLYNWTNPKTKKHSPMISKQFHQNVVKNSEANSVPIEE